MLKSLILSFQSVLACRGSQKLHVGYLVLTQRFVYLVSFVTQLPSGRQKVHEQCKLQIQGRMQIFEKMSQKALNRVLTPAVDRSRRELSESSGIIPKCAFCVELWSFYCKKRISVPMSYIVVLERVGWGDGPVIKVIKSRCWFPFSNLLVQRQKGNCHMMCEKIVQRKSCVELSSGI